MMSRSRLKTLALSASLFIPLSGCGVEEPLDTSAPQAQVPPEEALAAPEQSPTTEQAASQQTQAALGIQTWRMLESLGERARFEGVDAKGRVLLSGISTPVDGGFILDIIAPAPMSFRVDANFRLVEGDASQPIFAALHRDLLTVPAAPQATPPLDISDFDLGQAETGALAEPSGKVAAFATDAERAVYRSRLTCHAQYATQAYEAVDGRPAVCGLNYVRGISTDVLKVWSSENATTRTHAITIAFAGTRGNFGDILRDAESQLYSTHQSPITPTLPHAAMLVGMGWEARWAKQAGLGLGSYLNYYAGLNLQRGYKMNVIVTGHSLGAVTATLAGFDIVGFLAQRGVVHRVAVTAFNPPRLGYASSRDEYHKRLFATCTNGDYGITVPCMILRQMTRGADPVHDVPLFMTHPVWQTANNANRSVGPGPYGSNASLPYCPQYHAPHRSLIDLVANHSLDAWTSDIVNMPNNHLDCLYLGN